MLWLTVHGWFFDGNKWILSYELKLTPGLLSWVYKPESRMKLEFVANIQCYSVCIYSWIVNGLTLNHGLIFRAWMLWENQNFMTNFAHFNSKTKPVILL